MPIVMQLLCASPRGDQSTHVIVEDVLFLEDASHAYLIVFPDFAPAVA
jgi:hypothetical protein